MCHPPEEEYDDDDIYIVDHEGKVRKPKEEEETDETRSI